MMSAMGVIVIGAVLGLWFRVQIVIAVSLLTIAVGLIVGDALATAVAVVSLQAGYVLGLVLSCRFEKEPMQ